MGKKKEILREGNILGIGIKFFKIRRILSMLIIFSKKVLKLHLDVMRANSAQVSLG